MAQGCCLETLARSLNLFTYSSKREERGRQLYLKANRVGRDELCGTLSIDSVFEVPRLVLLIRRLRRAIFNLINYFGRHITLHLADDIKHLVMTYEIPGCVFASYVHNLKQRRFLLDVGKKSLKDIERLYYRVRDSLFGTNGTSQCLKPRFSYSMK